MTVDTLLLFFLHNLTGKSQVFDMLIIFLASYLPYFLIVGLLFLLYFGVYSRKQKFHFFWVTAVSVVIASLGVTELIRFFYHRPWPFLLYSLHPLISENEWSFPSDHSAFFFAMAMAIYLYNKKWGIWFFIAAILMNISRIVAGVHYPSDILGGAMVGIVVGYLVVCFAEKWKP